MHSMSAEAWFGQKAKSTIELMSVFFEMRLYAKDANSRQSGHQDAPIQSILTGGAAVEKDEEAKLSET